MESILCAYLFIWIGGCLQHSLAVSVLDEYTKAAGYQLGKTPKILFKKKKSSLTLNIFTVEECLNAFSYLFLCRFLSTCTGL